jgi:hypothetical protein
MTDEIDPKGLIRESYRIEGIGPGECRSIFVDWALSLDPKMPARTALPRLIDRYATAHPGHPMNEVLAEGVKEPDAPRRRGGRAGRVRSS